MIAQLRTTRGLLFSFFFSSFSQLTEQLTISFDVWFCCPYHPDKVALIHCKGQRQLLINREGNGLMGLSEWHLTPNPPNPKMAVTPSQCFILVYSWTSEKPTENQGFCFICGIHIGALPVWGSAPHSATLTRPHTSDLNGLIVCSNDSLCLKWAHCTNKFISPPFLLCSTLRKRHNVFGEIIWWRKWGHTSSGIYDI